MTKDAFNTSESETSKRLRMLRIKNGYTIKYVCECIGVEPITYVLFESNYCTLHSSVLEKLEILYHQEKTH